MGGTLPGSGVLRVNTINTVGERSPTAYAPLSGSSSTPQAGSLVKLYAPPNSTVNQIAPHRFSEFYGKTWSGVYQIQVNTYFKNSPEYACWDTSGTTIQLWKTNGATGPTQGDIIYTNATATSFAASGAYIYGTITAGGGTANEVFCVGSSGVVTNPTMGGPNNSGCTSFPPNSTCPT